MKKKTVNTIQRILIVLLTVLLGFSYTGSAIAFENVEVISDALGVPTYEIITDENAANEDTQYYKSEFSDLAEVIEAGNRMVEEVVAEGAVLLKNENHALPLLEGERKISVFGTTSADPVYSGTGSGKVDVKQCVDYYSSFEAAGLTLNPILTENYTTTWFTAPEYGEEYNPDIHFRRNVAAWAGAGASYISEVPWATVMEVAEDSFAQYGDAAVYIFGRIGGEGADLRMDDSPDGFQGDYLHLSEKEMDTLKGIKALKDQGIIKRTIVIINSASMVACDFLKDESFGVDAAIWTGNLGSHGTRAIGKILTGEVVPSGKITDTIWMDNAQNPVNVVFGYREYKDSEKYNLISLGGSMFANEPTLNSYVVYQEGMYLGYRYTETRYEDYVTGAENAGDFDYDKVVAYPFGYGISYTEFEYSDFSAKKTDTRTYEFSVKVTNTGDLYSGKEAVEFYLSKPYGDYAKANKIQVPSVELLEFGKTKLLAPGESETITVTVDEKYFASFDTFNTGTYVLMDGDYYVTVAANAHEAVNNILEAKGLANEKMIGSGNADLVASFRMKHDSTTYAVSEVTGKPISTMFGYADINTYEGRGDNQVTYYDRSDWKGTVSFDRENGFPVLTATQAMADTIFDHCPVEYKREIPKDPEPMDYPTYGKDAGLQLIDLMSDENGDPIDIDDPIWDTFIDQLTWDEIALLVSNGQHFTAVVESISKPRTSDQNGPNGFNWEYKQGKTGLYFLQEIEAGHVDEKGKLTKQADPLGKKKTTAFPANGVIGSTFNKDVAYRTGKMIGENGLWAGCSGLYGIGANIHRSPYQGRAAEYYSECGTMTGLIAAYECKGIEEKGVHVFNKHSVGNDQENARHGVCCWMLEQPLREIYLRAFEIPIRVGGAYNTMSAFSRLGVIAGAADGTVCQNYLRDECGMKGIVVSDMYTDMSGAQDSSSYFELAYGMYNGGCDLPDGTGQEWQFEAYKPDGSGKGDYATMAWRMRAAAKRICFATLTTNAMNGVSRSTRTVRITPTWVKALKTADIVLACLFALVVLWTIVYAVRTKKKISASK